MSTLETPMMPRWFVPVTGLVLAGVIGVSAVARLSTPRHAAPVPAIASASLRFADLPDGGVRAVDAAGRTLAIIPARDDGFLRMTLHLLVETRVRAGADPQAPFTLTEHAGGHFVLTDPESRESIELEAFGPSNVAEFAALLQDKAL
jgi:putative photosynthetic complex assembly protein